MKKAGMNNIIVAGFLLVVLIALGVLIDHLDQGILFNGRQAYTDIRTQLAFGPRTPGSVAHQQTGNWILLELMDAGWQTEEQIGEMNGHPIRNLIARRGSGNPLIIISAHYDSRMEASKDQDIANRTMPVPGANDGASGVAVLLGLARSLPEDLPGQVWLVFFDAEDQGNLSGWDWILGSRFFVNTLQGKPEGVVVVDMIGDADLQICVERNSDPVLTGEIWGTADLAGFSQKFLPVARYEILDDHLPFLENDIPAVLLIDFDYPWWHTTADTLDKVSVDSLDAVGDVLYRWIIQKLNGRF
jgi:glutaminyl-peptide cyclotransferase